MRILYLVGGAKYAYGSEQVAMRIIEQLSKRGVEFVVITANAGPVNDFCKNLKIKNYTIPFKFYNYKKPTRKLNAFVKRNIRRIQADMADIKAMNSIENLVDLTKIDIIHSNLSRTLIGGRLSHKYGIPHIWHLQEMYQGHYGLDLLKKNQIDWMNSHATRFIAISDVVKEGWSSAGLDIKKIDKVYNGIDVDAYQVRQKDVQTGVKLKIVMAGDLCEEKGQQLLLQAVQTETSIRDNIEIDLYGEGKQQFVNELEEYSKMYHLPVSFKGFCNDLADHLCEYDIGVVCSKGEGFGLSTLEYMASGLCVVVSNTGANEELVINNESGYVFDRNKPEEIIIILRRLINDPNIIEKIGIKARERAKSIFSISSFSDSVLKIYEKLEYKSD